MDRLIDMFVEKVLSTDESFVITTGNNRKEYHYFTQNKVGNARYIYSEYSYDDELFYSNIYLKFKLVAIINDENVYIIDNFALNIYIGADKDNLPTNTYRIQELCDSENEKVSSVIFPKFYDSLPVGEITDENIIRDCVEMARKKILVDKSTELEVKTKPMFTIQDVANYLCGFIELKEEAIVRLEEQKDFWIKRKSYNSVVEKYIKDRSVVKEYEIKIAEGIKSVDANTVTVEFELNGKKASEKINTDKLLFILYDDDYFSGYDFSVAKQGKKLIEKLDAAEWRQDSKGKMVLTCENIVKIIYRKKILYQRY